MVNIYQIPFASFSELKTFGNKNKQMVDSSMEIAKQWAKGTYLKRKKN